MRFSLAQVTRRTRNPRRSQIPLREIVPPAVLATNLYRAAYLPTVQAWDRAANRIVAEYERTLSRLTTDSTAGLDTEFSFIEGELQRLFLELTPRLRDWILRVERWHRGKWRGAVLSATGVDLQTLIGPEDVQETLDALIARNVALVKDVSAQARGRISDSVFRGLTDRRPAREAAQEVREAVAMSRRRSLNIASDQLTKVSSALDGERMRQAGIEKWKWMHSGKLHPRAEHKARNGKIYSFAEPPPDMPGEKPFCGCRKLAVVELD